MLRPKKKSELIIQYNKKTYKGTKNPGMTRTVSKLSNPIEGSVKIIDSKSKRYGTKQKTIERDLTGKKVKVTKQFGPSRSVTVASGGSSKKSIRYQPVVPQPGYKRPTKTSRNYSM